ncbi:hypothetical protein BACFRA24663_09435 [Bacteroides fragilis]
MLDFLLQLNYQYHHVMMTFDLNSYFFKVYNTRILKVYDDGNSLIIYLFIIILNKLSFVVNDKILFFQQSKKNNISL